MFRLGFALLGWSLLWVGSLGCSSRPLTPTGPRLIVDGSTHPSDAAKQPSDGSTRPSDAATRPFDAATRPFDASTRPLDAGTRPFDASARSLDGSPRPLDAGPDALGCGCRIDTDGVMHMSWSCFQTAVWPKNELLWCGAPGALNAACGLVVYTYYDENGLLQEYVYDEGTGEEVGGHVESAYTAIACPDQDLSALKVESGTFPASSCTTRTPCGCTADGRTLACPPPDAGGPGWDAGACDCRIDGDGVLRMSWDCFCAAYGCAASPHGWCGAPGQWTTGCGLQVFTWNRLGLTQILVFDQTGTQVGGQMQNGGTNFFECPTDPTLQSPTVAGGAFPAASCTTAVCPCDRDPGGGFTGTFTCPASDAGAADGAADR